MSIGDRIKKIRREQRLSKAALGRKVGVSREAVFQWESRDTKGLKAENLIKVSKALGVNPAWLQTGRGENVPQLVSSNENPYHPSLDQEALEWALEFIEDYLSDDWRMKNIKRRVTTLSLLYDIYKNESLKTEVEKSKGEILKLL